MRRAYILRGGPFPASLWRHGQKSPVLWVGRCGGAGRLHHLELDVAWKRGANGPCRPRRRRGHARALGRPQRPAAPDRHAGARLRRVLLAPRRRRAALAGSRRHAGQAAGGSAPRPGRPLRAAPALRVPESAERQSRARQARRGHGLVLRGRSGALRAAVAGGGAPREGAEARALGSVPRALGSLPASRDLAEEAPAPQPTLRSLVSDRLHSAAATGSRLRRHPVPALQGGRPRSAPLRWGSRRSRLRARIPYARGVAVARAFADRVTARSRGALARSLARRRLLVARRARGTRVPARQSNPRGADAPCPRLGP